MGGFIILNNTLFNKIEKKTNINKETILSLAEKLEKNDLKDENTIRDIIKQLSTMTNKNVSKEKEDKIIKAILNDKIPKNIEKMF